MTRDKRGGWPRKVEAYQENTPYPLYTQRFRDVGYVLQGPTTVTPREHEYATFPVKSFAFVEFYDMMDADDVIDYEKLMGKVVSNHLKLGKIMRKWCDTPKGTTLKIFVEYALVVKMIPKES